jgi:hypothetical protein
LRRKSTPAPVGKRRIRKREDSMMTNDVPSAPLAEVARLSRELEEAELYEQKLRQMIVAIRDELASGHAARALSLCNEALNEIDYQTDVVAPSRSHDAMP